jgi:hypothetical protein
MSRSVSAFVALLAAVTAACSRPEPLFNDQHAKAHVGMLADTIGSRPVGTEPNARARAYIVDQLRLAGYDVRVQEVDGRRPELGRTARVANIIAVRQGTRDEAIGLLSHYDSVPDAPGAADDAFGVAVSLEAARVLAARADRQWSLMVLVSDGEEAGLMGAAALVTDREVMRRLQVYFNVESAGSGGPALLFESGPGNGWLVGPWARHTPHPRGDSFGVEIYRRLPNDTDFSIFKRHGIPGLNFAAVGDSYAYHTARDTAERLSTRTIRETGENVVALVTALDGSDILHRTASEATYFDIAGVAAVSFGPWTAWLAAGAALILGVVAWVRVSAAAIAMGGLGRWLLTIVWTIAGAAIVAAMMIGATWALRAAREVYHPWYARPDRLILLLLTVGVATGWGIVRIGRWLPARAHGLRHPVVTWSIALPIWILLAVFALWAAPAAAYLWTLPLLSAGLLLAVLPPASGLAIRAASVLVFAVCGTLWLHDLADLMRFVVAIFGRLPLVTPVFVYAAIMLAGGIMLVPPFVATVARSRPLLRPSLMTALLLLAVAVTAALAYLAPAYTPEEPLRRRFRALQPAAGQASIMEVGGVEPGLDLMPGAPGRWTPSRAPLPGHVPWSTLSYPFVFRAMDGPPLGPAPADISNFSIRPLPGGSELDITVVPREAGLTVTFLLPPAFAPARSSLPGLERGTRWSATYVAVPPEGVAFRASFKDAPAEALRATEVIVISSSIPGGTGWQRLPDWLPQDRMVWTATAAWQIRPGDGPAIAPVPPLR